MLRRRRPFAPVMLVGMLLAVSTASAGPAPPPSTVTVPASTAETPSPPAPGSDDADWLQFRNGEWLRGEFKDLLDHKIIFDSDEMDELDLDWDDVHALYLPKLNTLMFRDRSVLEGHVRIEGDTLVVTTDEGEHRYPRDRLRSLIPGERTERNFWSGSLSLGGTVRSGNVDQTDVTLFTSLQRRDERSRLYLEYTGTYGSVDKVETVNEHRGLGYYDVYLSERFYLTPIRLSALRDEFQNIEYRLTPSTGLGYDVIDESRLEWTVTAGFGWEFTRFFDPEPGKPLTEDSAAVLLGSRLEWEATPKVDVGATFDITIPVPDTNTYNLRAVLWTEIDIVGDLDLEVRFTWDRVNNPSPDTDGTIPDSDDLRLYVGLGWSF